MDFEYMMICEAIDLVSDCIHLTKANEVLPCLHDEEVEHEFEGKIMALDWLLKKLENYHKTYKIKC